MEAQSQPFVFGCLADGITSSVSVFGMFRWLLSGEQRLITLRLLPLLQAMAQEGVEASLKNVLKYMRRATQEQLQKLITGSASEVWVGST